MSDTKRTYTRYYFCTSKNGDEEFETITKRDLNYILTALETHKKTVNHKSKERIIKDLSKKLAACV